MSAPSDNDTAPLTPPDQQDPAGRPAARGNAARGNAARGNSAAVAVARFTLGKMARSVGLVAGAIIGIIVLVVALSAIHLLPKLRNPFTETTVDRSQPAVLKSITALSRFEAASGQFQVVVDLAKKSSFLPSFIEGTDTLFIGSGNDIAYVDFSHLKGNAIVYSHNRKDVTVTLPPAQLEPAVLNVKRSYVFAEQQGLLNRIGNFFSSNPNNQQQVYISAQKKIQAAAQHSPLTADAERNTTSMLNELLRSLGFQKITINYSTH
jgi:hypothetical protein